MKNKPGQGRPKTGKTTHTITGWVFGGMKMKERNKVHFEYWDNDLCKDVSGIGWIKEIDTDNNQIIVSTTRGIKWMEPDAIKKIL